MVINNISGRITGTPASNNLTAQSAVKTSKEETTTDNNVAELSSERFKTALGSDAQAPVNSARVASLKQAIADGSYQVNAERIAAKIIHSENTLLGN